MQMLKYNWKNPELFQKNSKKIRFCRIQKNDRLFGEHQLMEIEKKQPFKK
jgi:hypothetical protein